MVLVTCRSVPEPLGSEYDDGHQLGQRDVLELLPLAGAVDGAGLVQLLVKARQRGQVDDGSLAGVLPDIGAQEDPGPVLLHRIELHGVLAQHGVDLVEEAVGGDHGVQRVHDHDPADEIGHEQDGVIDLGGLAVAHFVDQHRQAHLQHHAHHHEQQVVAHGVADQHRRVLQQVGEVVQPVPFRGDQAVQKDVLEEGRRGGNRHLVLLERQDDAGHRQICKRQQEQHAGQHHKQVCRLTLAGIRKCLGFSILTCLKLSNTHAGKPPFRILCEEGKKRRTLASGTAAFMLIFCPSSKTLHIIS